MSDLVELAPGEWALWREVAIRAAGFPVDGLERFGEGENEHLVALGSDPRFREALTWQNRDALRNALERVSSDGSGSNHRRRVATIASYWQRYCAKNDTIGFFGPLGWGELTDDGAAATLEPGHQLLAARDTRFEVWAIDALASALAADPSVKRWIPPRRHPASPLLGLDAGDLDVLARCDGRPAFEVAPPQVLDRLVERGLVVWAFRVPLSPHPENDLRAQLADIGDMAVRDDCLEVLARLDAARAAVAAVAGDAEALGPALDELDRTFASLTGHSPHRRPGEMYAGRSVCYEDCRRDLTVRFGPAVVSELGRALLPVLAGARWFCGEVFELGCRLVAATLDEARAELGTARVPLAEVWRRALPRFLPPSVRREMPTPFEGLGEVVSELQRRWTDLLAGDLDALPERAAATFAGAKPAWPRAAFHGPDVQIAASSIDAINRGDFLVVVGDFHPGSATIGQALFLEGHPDPDHVRRFLARVIPVPRFHLVMSRRLPRVGGRFYAAYATPDDYNVLSTEDTCMPNGYRCLGMAELWVADVEGEPAILGSDGARLGRLSDAFEHLIFLGGVLSYNPFLPSPHSPRLTAGRTVLRRETWTFPSAGIDWPRSSGGAHEGAGRWAASLDMPRRVFALVSGEPKPIYVDFDSPALVSVLARQIRGAPEGRVRISEMLPGPGETWLTDADGRRYTSELRLTAVDLTRMPRQA